MEAVIYIRARSSMPGDVCTAPERERRIREYAASRGIGIGKVYADAQDSHEAEGAFLELLEDGVRRRFENVLIDSVFTAGRDVTAAKYVLLGAFFPAGIHFISVSDGFESRGRSAGEVEEYFRRCHYRCQGRKRAERNLQPRRRPPYGLRKSDGVLVTHTEEAETVRRIFRMRSEGLGPELIARTLNGEGVPSPSGDCPWYGKRVLRILRDRLYIEPKYGPIVEPELFEEIERRHPNRSAAAECLLTPEENRRRAVEAALAVAAAHGAKMAAYRNYRETMDAGAREEFDRASRELDMVIRETEGVLTECAAAVKCGEKTQ